MRSMSHSSNAVQPVLTKYRKELDATLFAYLE
jgi:hypothetical protein